VTDIAIEIIAKQALKALENQKKRRCKCAFASLARIPPTRPIAIWAISD
jgi:hypothetical protein